MNIRNLLRRNTALIMAALLTGCSNMEPQLSAVADKASDVYSQLSSIAVENRAPLTIHLWHGFSEEDAAALVEITEEFNATVGEEHSIKVKLTAYAGIEAVEEAVYKAIEEEETKTDDLRRTPDLFFALDDTAYQMDRMGVAVHMDNFFPDGIENTLLDAVKQDAFPGEYDAMVLLPVAVDSTVLLVDETAWMDFCSKTADPESGETVYDDSFFATWEGIGEAARAYQQWLLLPAEGEEPMEPAKAVLKRSSFFAADSWGALMTASYRGADGTMFSVDKESVQFDFDRSKIHRFWDFWYAGAIDGIFSQSGCAEAFENKEAVAGLVSVSKACDYPSSAGISVYQTPAFSEGMPVTMQETIGLVALEGNQEHKDSVKVFLNYLIEPERLAQVAVSTGRLPSTKASVSDEVLQEAFRAQSLSSLEQTVLRKAKEQLYSHIQHSTAVFSGGSELMETMDAQLLSTAKSVSGRYESVVAAGLDPLEAYALMVNEIQFDRWYTAFRDALVEQVLIG